MGSVRGLLWFPWVGGLEVVPILLILIHLEGVLEIDGQKNNTHNGKHKCARSLVHNLKYDGRETTE